MQIFVLDDASTDSTVDQLKRFKSVKVIECKENSGFTISVNSGLKFLVESGFEYIYLLNNDTFLLPGFLTNALELIESNSKIAMVGSKLLTSMEHFRNVVELFGVTEAQLTLAVAHQMMKVSTNFLAQLITVQVPLY